ncbi:MAG: hypothetical protein PHP59_08015 [Methanofollis sp.]|uniref:hypothetical protein n=1 Tax=Methanofollis sp. TaxID=2052835 RepID=UPI002628B252|nr:hypothetical protein [Methanofollis sp.]MDD4255305.1 hypothetical protein [Methanofollis sp.]
MKVLTTKTLLLMTLTGVLLVAILTAGCCCATTGITEPTSSPELTNQEAINDDNDYITVNLCKIDPENADYWKKHDIYICDSPERTHVVDKIPAAGNVRVKIIDTATYEGRVYYKISYDGGKGWVSKLMLTGSE